MSVMRIGTNIRGLLFACCLAVVGQQALAFDARGARSCAGWQEFRQDEAAGFPLNASIYQTWIVGYLSGMVAGAGVDFLAGTDNETIFRMVDAYCTDGRENLATVSTFVARTLLQQKGIVYSGTRP